MRTRLLIAAIAAAAAAAVVALLAGGDMPAPAARPSVATTTAGAALPARPVALPTAGAESARDATLDDLLGGLATAGGERLEVSMKESYFALVEALRARPDLVLAVEAMLATADREDPQARVALGALVGAGTAEAQAALGRLLDARRGDADFVKLLVPSVGFLEHPTPAIEQAVRTLAADDPRPQIRTMAGLSVGIMASHLDATDPARARAIVADIDARLRAATTPADLGAQLTVLGNAGTADAGQVASRYLGDDRAAVRASALEALRRVTSPDAEAALLRALATDPDPTVRASAAWAMGHRPATPANLRAQAAALLVETDERVARPLADNLWNGADADRRFAIATLDTVAARHALPSIRDAVRALLASQAGT
jgi:hypothetical protein